MFCDVKLKESQTLLVEWMLICNLMCIIRSYLCLKTCQHSENSLTAYAEYVTQNSLLPPKGRNRERKITRRCQDMEMLRCRSESGCQTTEKKSSKVTQLRRAQPESRAAKTITVSMNYELDSHGGRCRLYSKITISPPTADDSEQ